MPGTTALLTAVAFLAGSFPSGVVLGKLLVGGDVRGYGSGNIGAANAARFGGFRLGAAVGVLDVLKGLLPVLLGRALGMGAGSLAVIALAAVLGHDFSIFLRFKGGKGVATTLGTALALAPVPAVLAAATWLLVLGLWGFSSLASLVALALLPFYLGVTGSPPVWVVLAFALFLLAAVKHWPNIVRLANGTEPGMRRRLLGG
jgi:glycerol-3-phosphate acyltransferase PlsY